MVIIILASKAIASLLLPYSLQYEKIMKRKSPPCQFGNAFRMLRKSLGIKQAEVAARTGRTVQQISQIERGEREPRFSTILLLAYSLGISPAELVRITAESMPDPVILLREEAEKDL